MNNQTPSWLQELLDAQEAADEQRAIEMNKVMADRALAAISAIEDKINEVDSIAMQEAEMIAQWQELQTAKLHKQISWLSWNLEQYLRKIGDATVALPHGTIKMRKSRDKVEIVDQARFMPIAQKLGLVRIIEAKAEPDMNAIRAHLKLNGNKPLAGLMITVGTPTFTFSTNKKGVSYGETERTEAESGRPVGSVHQTQAAA